MNEQSREALDAYYAEAASWNRDRVEAARRSQQRSWWIAGAATLVAVLEGLALVILTPLKTVVPYTLLVDRNTGYVQALKPLSPEAIAPDTALTQSYLVQYVIARQSFDMASLNANYRKVALFSTGPARSSYLAQMATSNPESPLVAYPRSTLIETRVKSVSPVGKDVAMVRFDTVREDPGSGVQQPMPWVAVVRYGYSGAPMRLEDRFINPLGFQVLSYRVDPEAVPPQLSPPAASPESLTAVVRTGATQPSAASGTANVLPAQTAAKR